MKLSTVTTFSVLAILSFSFLSVDLISTKITNRKPASEPSKELEEVQHSLCLSKRHEAELEEQLKKQLKDKEDILKEIDSLKTEVKQKKVVVAEPAPTPVPVAEKAPQVDIVSLMAQLTSLLQIQQQNQFQLQSQMMNIYSSMNYNLTPPSMINSLSNISAYGIGMNPGYNFQIQNPYATMPLQIPMVRSQIPLTTGFNFQNSISMQ
jgi:hypothetical protein